MVSHDHPVQILDLMPTLVKLAGATPPAGLSGYDLLDEPPATAAAYAEFGDMLALRTERHMVVARSWRHGGTSLDPALDERLSRTPPYRGWTLHDLRADPTQRDDLSLGAPDLLEQLAVRLLAVRDGPGAVPGGGLSEEQVAALRASGALGYW
jgi:arylsulfatase A-like enzyme